MTVIMSFVIIMIVFMIIMIVVVIIVVAMIFVMVVMMIFIVILIMVIVMIMILVIVIMVIVVIIDVNLAVKVFSLSPNQSRSNGSFDRERAAIIEAPLEDTAKHAIDGVMLGIPLKVGVKSTMAFDGDDGREIEFTGLERLSTTTMGAMGFSR